MDQFHTPDLYRPCMGWRYARRRLDGFRSLVFAGLFIFGSLVGSAQDCNEGYTFTASPPPVGGTYSSGQSVTFTYTITDWTVVNVNWLHGVVPTFGAGWDQSTLSPGAPPPTCGTSVGTWGWFAVDDGTSGTSVGPVGPGFFFDLDNDGDPGNNFGDLCAGAWSFSFTINVASAAGCVQGADLNVSVDSYGDSETGSWGTAGCGSDPIPALPATTNCCSADAGNNGAVTACTTGAAINLANYLGGTPDPGGTWIAPGGAAIGAVINPASAASGNYTYTVTQVAPVCSSSAVVAVTITAPPNAGTDGALTICSTAVGPTALFPLLGGGAQAGGTWTNPAGANSNGNFNPANHIPGIYTYTIPGTAPCPSDQATVLVTMNTPPNAGTDGAITLCSTGMAAGLFASLAGSAQAGGTWTAPGGGAFSGTYDPATDAPGVYTYTVTGTPPCPNDQATVTVAETAPPNAGTDGAITFCSAGAATGLFASLTGGAQAGGTWTAPGGGAFSGTYDPTTDAPGVYTYTVAGTAPCPNDQAIVTVAETVPPNAGTDGAITFCSTGATAGLFASLAGGAEAGGTWTAPGGGAFSGSYDPAVNAPGVYTYTVTGTAPCPNDQATVTVAETAPPNAGTDGAVTLCSTGAATGLFALLGGAAQAGGTWTEPGGGAFNGTFIPGTSVPGLYTYTATGTAPCPNDQSTVTVTINTPPDPGTDGNITLCSSDVAASLLAQLGGTPAAGGAWSGPSPVVGGVIDPATMSPGVYTYTVNGTAPCPNETAAVTVTINTPPDPGTDGIITLCSSGAAVPLIASLGGTPDAGGAWSGPSPVVGGMINPATMSAGVYTYTVNGTTPCPNETATVTVTINTPPDPGTDGTITLCSSDAAASLFAELGGTPAAGGAWSGPSPVVGGVIDPATMSPGVYTYTVNGTAPCPNETAAVTVTINTPPDPGTDGTITLCSSGAAVPLIASLGGTPDVGGAWSGPSPVVGGMINPATMSAGVYTYTVNGTTPCPNETATVTVTINTPPDPGTDGTITLCSSDAAASLFAELGGTPAAGGAWSGPSPVVGGVIDPATMSAGVYTYTVNGTAPCPNETATVTVTINTPPDPGTDGTITLCSSGAAVPLIASLGGTPDVGGAWSGPSPVVGGMINPATMSAGVYTYTVNGTAPCPNETATVTVTINTPPDPGTDGTITLCSSDAAASLFAELGGTPAAGGAWSGPSPVVGGVIDPATMSAGVYNYTVNGTAPCPNETATVTVTINTPPDPGTDGTITLCSSGAAVPLIASLGGTPDVGGAWSGPSPVVGGMINPATMSAGVYTYTVNGTAPCPNETATVTVTINTPPDPGTDGTITLCSSDAAASLFAELGGTPAAGGAWSGPSPVVVGMIDPATMSAGVYNYTVNGTAPCPNETATVTVTIAQVPNAGTDGALTLCISSPTAAMVASLGGTPSAGGTWSGPSSVVGGQFDPATMNGGVYAYTVAGTAPCPAATAELTVAVVAAPDAGTPGNATLCSTDATIDLYNELGGTPDAGGAWTGPSAVVGGMYDPATMNPGVYTYTIAVPPPCVNATSTVTVAETVPPNAGIDGTLTLCISSPATALINSLSGGPQAGGTWSGPSPVVGGSFNPATMTAGVYTYTVNGTAPCPNDDAPVTVNVVAAPDAGTTGNATLCTTDDAIDLYDELGGTPDAGGSWTGPSAVVGGLYDPATMNPGVYTYTIAVPPPCVNATSTVTVAETVPPNAGVDGTLTLCISSPATALINSLSGGPQAGGTWSGPSPVVGGSFNPATMTAGVYTYTVTGTAPCANDAATVIVNVVSAPDAGTPGNATLCTTDATIDLYNELGGTPDGGGAWTGPSAVVGGLYDPATMNPGVYTYTIAVPPPCVNATSTVTIAETVPPNAGIDGTLTLCISSPATALINSLSGGPQAGGTWSGPSPVVGGAFNPATMTAGVYTYMVTGTAPCANDAATVTVNVVAAPDAGTPGNATLCTTDAAIALYDELGGTPDAGGAWTGPSAAVGGLYDPATMNPGVYTYTIAVPPPCVNATSTVTIAETAPPNAGADGTLTLCISSPAAAMLPNLGGAPNTGGAWSGPSPVVGGSFNPATMTAGVYTYTVAGGVPCPAASADLTVAVVAAPDAGTPGNATLCTTDDAIALYDELGGTQDAGGAWTGPSAVVGGLYDPATMNPGVYTYTIAVPPPCVNATSTVTIAETAPPNAGADGTLTLCISSPAAAMLPNLGGAPNTGGAWSGPSPVVGGSFNPATMTAGVYTYTVAGGVPCPAASADLTVAVVAAPDAGTPGNATLCTTDDAIALYDELGGTPDAGGAWTGPSAVVGGLYDPATMNPGVYTYTIAVPPPCVNATSTVTIAETAPPNAGIDGTLTLCISSPAAAMLPNLGGAPNAGGAWSGPSPVVGGSFNPATMNAGVYTYTVAGGVPCPAASADLTIAVVAAPDAGTLGNATLCTTDAAITLYNELGGTPDAGGTWTGPSAVVGGMYDPATMTPGVYTYTITVPPPCVNVSSTVTVGVVQPPDAGGDGSLTLCISSPAIALFSSLTGTPEAGGSWSGPSVVAGGQFDPSNMVSGTYTYTVNGTSPCPADDAVVEVTVVNTPDPGGPGSLTACSSDATVDLFTRLEGSPDAGGSWTSPSGTPVSGTFNPSSDAGGIYTYTLDVPPPCTSVSSTVTVDVITPPLAGADAALTLCISSPATQLFPLLGSTAEAGGAWSGPTSASFSGSFDPAINIAGDYHYTVAGTSPCPADVATITVAVVSEPDPGLAGEITLCASDPIVDLFSVLGGSPDGGGVWTAANGTAFSGSFDPLTSSAGVYTYTIQAPPPCASVSATVTVSVVQPPDAGSNGSITVCATGAPVDLFGILQGSPDAGGTWTNANGDDWSGTFNAATDMAGTYIYTVDGIAPCPATTAAVLVAITQEPNAGDDGILNLCEAGAPLDIFPSLGGADPGGSWTGPSGTSFTGTFTPGSDPSGAYVYTVVGIAPCPSASATLTVEQLSDPYAGEDGTLTLCSSSGALDPFQALLNNPDPGGTWFMPNGQEVTEPMDASTASSGSYTYIVEVPAPCVNDTAAVTITIVQAVSAGSDSTLVICSNSGAIDLFDLLGGTPDGNGTWSGPSATTGGLFDPNSNTPGNYVYTVQGTAPCPNETALITVDVESLPNAGTDGVTTVCPEAPNVDLFSLLGGDPDAGGSWTAPNGTPCDGDFDPGTDPTGTYTYTVYGITACPDLSASSSVSIFVVPTPNAGPDAIECSLGYSLNATGTWASGTWSGPAGFEFTSASSPASMAKAPAGGTYDLVWSVITSEGCAASDTVSITFTDPIIPIASPVDAVCNGICDGTAAVLATGGNVGLDGYSYQWSNGLAGNTPMAEGICAGSYSVLVADTNGCSTATPFIIGQPAPLVIDAVTVTAETCPGSCDGTLTIVDVEGVVFGLGNSLQPDNTFHGLCAGAYSVTMVDAQGCIATSIGMVPSPPPVIASFVYSPDTIFVDDTEVDFINNSSPNAVTFTWSFADLGASTDRSPTFFFPSGLGAVYTVCLTAADANGCSNEICLPVPIFDLLMVNVPNAFTPNGDGINDDFLPIFNLPWVVDYKFMVFNRWGEQIFGTDQPGKPWKGDYSDVVSKEEVYVWKLICRDQLSGELIERIGHVTLLK